MENRITAIIITKNESLHLQRCLNSIQGFVDDILVVDSFSNDNTKEIAQSFNTHFFERKFVSHADQINWAISRVDKDTTWIFRIDADEIATKTMQEFLKGLRINDYKGINGFTINRKYFFLESEVNFGGAYPAKILRIFRNGNAVSEQRIMDEQIIVSGKISHSNASIEDINLLPLSEWIIKHNWYSSLEAIQSYLDLTKKTHQKSNFAFSRETKFRRFMKSNIYKKLPFYLKVTSLFIYRIFLRGGIFSGKISFSYHLLQGIFYRIIVELKLIEITREISKGLSLEQSAMKLFNIDINNFNFKED